MKKSIYVMVDFINNAPMDFIFIGENQQYKLFFNYFDLRKYTNFRDKIKNGKWALEKLNV